jgi:hypothetical protein
MVFSNLSLTQFELVPSRVYPFQIVSTLFISTKLVFLHVTPCGVSPLTLPTLRVLLFYCIIVHDDDLLSDVVTKVSPSLDVVSRVPRGCTFNDRGEG